MRLGRRPKALLSWGDDAEPLVARVVAALEQVSSPVLVAATDGERFAFLERGLVADRLSGVGPLGGLLALLEASPHELCVVVGCDMPFLSPLLLARLIEVAHDDPRSLAVVPSTARGVHPLHAVYRRAILPLAWEHARAGRLALHDLARAAHARLVPEHELRALDPELRSLENVNTEEDLTRAVGAETAARALSRLRPDA